MASRLNPYLSFAGNARQAMEFYKEVFGGELNVNTFADFGNTEGEIANNVMHSQLETPSGYTLMASDMAPDQGAAVPNSAVSLSGDDADELRGYWEQLSGKGGTVQVPMEKQMWGDEFGMCVDQFGVPWMVNVVAQQG
ncbi:VOC family protein [Lentzea tibetensis]|uniref:VOC family protein n=1 Tax=Lentzea tibetensis TaxID=2591470 RepID=A0A563EKV0_9PSEU|nr:VOC family protein [Lentzea tibetensis]TWP47506.1 VOC family protein [Lentzea tibetensis]